MKRAYKSVLKPVQNTVLALRVTLRARPKVAVTAIGAGVLLCCVAIVLAFEPLRPSARVRASTPDVHNVAGAIIEPAGAVIAQSGPAARTAQVEVVTIRPDGFFPRQITRPRGRVLIAINNRSRFKEPTLRIDRVAGARLREVRVAARKVDWRGVVDLPPGEYVITEASHPEWSCTISVTDK